MLKEFKEFAMRGNVLDMAVGIIIGAAFGKIVTSLVATSSCRRSGLTTRQSRFFGLFLNLSGNVVSPRWRRQRRRARRPLITAMFLNTLWIF